VLLLQQQGLREEAEALVKRECAANSDLTDPEAKVTKLRYVAEIAGKKEGLECYKSAIELLIRCDRYDDAHNVLFDEYVPLMTELGQGEENVFL
jgi:hypothetical protein